MWFDGQREPNTVYAASISRGKDSTAMLRAIQLMGWPLDIIYSVDIWFDETTPAELPPMVKFKDEYDRKVLDYFGIPVTRLCATKRERENHSLMENTTHEKQPTADTSITELSEGNSQEQSRDFQSRQAAGANTSKRLTYCDIFYRLRPPRERESRIYGFPQVKGNWCMALKRQSPHPAP